MGKEIERKFLVGSMQWKSNLAGKTYLQGYLSTVKERTVRIRTIGDRAFLTIKGMYVDAARSEYEYEIPRSDAIEMLDQLCERPLIKKTRYKIKYKGFVWEVDEFHGENKGLIVAEIELPDVNQPIDLPPWVGKEITFDPRYYNANLIANPYKNWK